MSAQDEPGAVWRLLAQGVQDELDHVCADPLRLKVVSLADSGLPLAFSETGVLVTHDDTGIEVAACFGPRGEGPIEFRVSVNTKDGLAFVPFVLALVRSVLWVVGEKLKVEINLARAGVSEWQVG